MYLTMKPSMLDPYLTLSQVFSCKTSTAAAAAAAFYDEVPDGLDCLLLSVRKPEAESPVYKITGCSSESNPNRVDKSLQHGIKVLEAPLTCRLYRRQNPTSPAASNRRHSLESAGLNRLQNPDLPLDLHRLRIEGLPSPSPSMGNYSTSLTIDAKDLTEEFEKLQILKTQMIDAAREAKVDDQEVKVLRDGTKYKGQFVVERGRIIPEGVGKSNYPDSSSYFGVHHEGLRHGFGIYRFINRGVHEGLFSNDKRDGFGYFYLTNKETYYGFFKGGYRAGRGWSIWIDEGEQYIGLSLNQVPHGRGQYVWNDGGMYEGDLLEGKRHGHGQFWTTDGELYEGKWKNNVKHGEGTFYPNPKQCRKEYYVDSRLVRFGKTIFLNPLTLGVETAGDIMTPVIEKNVVIPTKKSQIFSTHYDNQPGILIRIFEGERVMTKDNHLLGILKLTGIPPSPRGVPQIEVTFEVDVDGTLRVSAEDKATGKRVKSDITDYFGRFSLPDVMRMLKEGEENAERDKKMKERIDAKIALEDYPKISSTTSWGPGAGHAAVGRVLRHKSE